MFQRRRDFCTRSSSRNCFSRDNILFRCDYCVENWRWDFDSNRSHLMYFSNIFSYILLEIANQTISSFTNYSLCIFRARPALLTEVRRSTSTGFRTVPLTKRRVREPCDRVRSSLHQISAPPHKASRVTLLRLCVLRFPYSFIRPKLRQDACRRSSCFVL